MGHDGWHVEFPVCFNVACHILFRVKFKLNVSFLLTCGLL